MNNLLVGYVSVATILVMILSGYHIAIALSLVSFAGIWLMTERYAVAASLIVNTSYNALADYVFAVVPLFIIMGLFATTSGATRDLFSAAELMLRRVRGGVGISTVVANAVFAAVTGTSVASAAMFSKLAIPEMNRLGYNKRFALGIVASSALLGMLIPPSVLMIIYGVITEQSIGRLFAAGVIPGLLVAFVLAIQIWIRGVFDPATVGAKAGVPIRPATWTELWLAVRNTAPIAALILIVLGGIYGGWYTPTEAGAIGAFGALVLLILKRKLSWSGTYGMLLDTGRATASIFFLLIAAQMYGRMLTLSGVPVHITQIVTGLEVPPLVILLLFVSVFVVLGCLIDSISIMLLTLPIMVPLMLKLGYHPIHFAMIAVVTIELGLLTPPFGLVVFAMKASLPKDVTLEDIFIGAMPFYAALLVALAVIIAFPSLSTWFPDVIYGAGK